MGKSTVAILAMLVILAVGLVSFNTYTAEAVNTTTTDTANVSVQVAALTLIDVTPNRFVFNNSALNPGSTGTSTDLYNQNRDTPGSMQIENIGSTNITHIWFNTTYESSNPFGQGDSDLYDSGNYVTIAREASSSYYFVNRVEYNHTRELVYLNRPAGWSSYGRIRNTTYEYFWVVEDKAVAANCNTTNIRIGRNYHSQSVEGSTNFDTGEGAADGTDFDEFTLNDAGWIGANVGYTEIDTGPLDGYAIAVWECGEKVMLYKYNMDAPGASADYAANSGTYASYFWVNTTDGNLHPGNSTVAKLQVRVPYGVQMGYSREGTITVLALSDQAS